MEQTLEQKIANVEVQKKYIGLAYDLVNMGTFPGHYSNELTETRMYLKNFFDVLDKTLTDLEAQNKPQPVVIPEVVVEVTPNA